jgi:hypothetical protein
METTSTILEDKLKFYFQRLPGETLFVILDSILMYYNERLTLEQATQVRSDVANYFNLYADFYLSLKEWELHVELRIDIIEENGKVC